MENINREGHKLLFKGEEFHLAKLLGLSRTAPAIEVKLEDLNLLGIIKVANEAEELPYVARHVPVLDEYQTCDLVFYKQEGKMTVLFGHEKARQAYNRGDKILKGRFISSPVLKRTRIEKPIDVAAVVKEKVQETTSFNAPRITQDRRPPQGERRGLPTQQARPPRAGERRYSSNETITRRGPRGS
jgi:hypothetical protein